MSILIKGMKMPKSCYDCTVRYACDAYWEFRYEHPYVIKSNGRMEDCPLVEIPKHGRLIDADRLYTRTIEQLVWCGDDGRDRRSKEVRVYHEEDVENAPTVIEGDIE